MSGEIRNTAAVQNAATGAASGVQKTDAQKTGRPLTSILGWTMVVAVINLLYVAVLIPETPMGSPGRAVVDKLHMSWGIVALALVITRLVLWVKHPPQPAPGMNATAFGVCRDISLALYICVIADASIGPIRAWSEGYTVPFFNLTTLPSLVPAKYELRVVAGYFHSAISFFITAIIPIGVVMSIVLGWRTRTPFYKLFPV
jgi:cytochrome b561